MKKDDMMDTMFPTRRVERKLRLHMGKVLTALDMCVLFGKEPTGENAIEYIDDLVRLVGRGVAVQFWVGSNPGGLGYAAKQPDPGKDEITGEQLPPPVYVHDSGQPVKPHG